MESCCGFTQVGSPATPRCALSLPLQNDGERKNNGKLSQGLRKGQGGHSPITIMGKTDSS